MKLRYKFQNFLRFLFGKNGRFGLDHESGLFFFDDEISKHFFSNQKRGLGLYRNGLKKRGDQIAKSYCLEMINFDLNDVVVDCGANYADLFLYLNRFIRPNNYYALEPSDNDYQAIKKNCPESNIYRKALAEKTGLTKFYIDTKKADSSVIEHRSYTSVEEVECLSLNDFVSQVNLEKIKLLKLEAEGFEPEILRGSTEVLSRIEFVAIDGGYERGVSCDETFSFQVNFLTKHGFEMIGVYFQWGRALFRNTRIDLLN